MAAKKSPKQSTDTPVSAKKTPTKKAVKKTAKPVKAATKRQLTREEIACEAFYVYERRVEQGLPGDPHGDWLEAERILRERLR